MSTLASLTYLRDLPNDTIVYTWHENKGIISGKILDGFLYIKDPQLNIRTSSQFITNRVINLKTLFNIYFLDENIAKATVLLFEEQDVDTNIKSYERLLKLKKKLLKKIKEELAELREIIPEEFI